MTRSEPKVTVAIPTFNRGSLLRQTLESVLAQSYRDQRILISDNASEDDTPDVVASFNDPRIEYVRSDVNIGMIGNFNRALALTRSEYVVLLPDDDILYPDHLRSTIDVLEQHPGVGVVHTGFDLIDESSRVLEHARVLVGADRLLAFETGDQFMARSMRSPWTVCWPTAIFRTRAVEIAGGLDPEEEPLADFPLLMRIACDWSLASISRPLAALRFHAAAATAALGTYTGAGYDLQEEQPRILHNHRLRFLERAPLPRDRAARYRALADETFRRETVAGLAARAGVNAPWRSVAKELVGLIVADRRILLLPPTWRLIAAQLGGRRLKRALARPRDRTP
jgi:glycosyl transferase family 2